jgi:benzoyl-CoA reductase/2-hydroxyglutaryl-CoA dehydratase subunit BcrC/BadD/HgdB
MFSYKQATEKLLLSCRVGIEGCHDGSVLFCRTGRIGMTSKISTGTRPNKEEEEVKTAASKKTLLSASNQWQFIKEDYRLGHEWKAQGKPIVWSCTAIPKEIYWGMGIRPFHPEQYAAVCSVQRRGGSKDESVEKETVRFCRIAETAGFRDYLCGYARTGLGYVLNGNFTDAPLGGMPLPDVLVTSSTLCDVRLKWFEDMAERLNVPLFTLDIPEMAQDLITVTPNARSLVYPFRSTLKRGEIDVLTEGPTDWAVDYLVAQLEELIGFLEHHAGVRYDKSKLNESLDWSHKTVDVRLEILELRKALPAPMSAADGFGTMYPGLFALGIERTYDFYVAMRDELRRRVATGTGVLPNEKFRLLWYGVPPWYNMSIMNYFEPYGGVFAYEQAYNPNPWPMRRPDNPLKELALIILQEGRSVGSVISRVIHDCREYNISGVVLSYVITCRPLVFPAAEIRNMLQAELGVPVAILEGDVVDETLFSEGQVRTRLDALAEELMRR